MDMLLKRMKADVNVHGFRSTFRDWAGDETEFPREIAEAALGHKVGDAVEQAYRRGTALERRRKLMAAWSHYLEGASAREAADCELEAADPRGVGDERQYAAEPDGCGVPPRLLW